MNRFAAKRLVKKATKKAPAFRTAPRFAAVSEWSDVEDVESAPIAGRSSAIGGPRATLAALRARARRTAIRSGCHAQVQFRQAYGVDQK